MFRCARSQQAPFPIFRMIDSDTVLVQHMASSDLPAGTAFFAKFGKSVAEFNQYGTDDRKTIGQKEKQEAQRRNSFGIHRLNLRRPRHRTLCADVYLSEF